MNCSSPSLDSLEMEMSEKFPLQILCLS
uniref:Uncharacterized protein n=1 Tax=Anguilla anguilla TaxID=7936 RepID=A0A0E9UGH0_ANGAN